MCSKLPDNTQQSRGRVGWWEKGRGRKDECLSEALHDTTAQLKKE